ncbi:MAG TPA: enoyl-ACP reductase FabI [Mycobacteriales bacterium]|nr:enoyl-ACP reductase FabI [Mycobacteriales bacterium]
MGLLDNKTVLVTGVLTEASIGFRVAERAQREGAAVILTGVGRSLSLTGRIARRLPEPAPVLPLDVTDRAQLDRLADAVGQHCDRLDGVLHAIGFAPPEALGGGFPTAGWDEVATTLQVSTYSLVALARAALPVLSAGGSIVGLDFDASRAWPAYDWMGVAKAGLESAARYLARDLGPRGIRVNLVAAGPLRTMAARSIPGFAGFEQVWKERAPLGWDVEDAEPVARACVALLSDWFPATTGAIVHVDGGVHAVGA